LSVSEKTIYRMIRNETIPCFRVGGQWRFDRREMNSWIEDTRAFSAKAGIAEAFADGRKYLAAGERRGGYLAILPFKNNSKMIDKWIWC